jgi:hypothetical protein
MRGPRLCEADRTKIILYRFEFHHPVRKIAKKVKCSISTVHHVCQQHVRHVNVEKLRHHGRKQLLSPCLLNHLFNIIRHNKNITSTELSRHFFHHDNITLSDRTIRNYRRMIFHPVHEILIPPLQLRHYLDRIDYCLTHKSSNFHTIVFSDEKSFCLDHTSNIVWIEDNEPIPTREVSSTHTSVMVWAGMWYRGRTELCFVNGSIDYRKYIQILDEYLLPSMPNSNRFLFQQDNARPHIKIDVICWLRDHAVRLLDPWPAYSPDFNPIEHVWSWMAQYVKNEHPHDRPSLVESIERAWDAIPQKIIQAYIDALPARLQAVYNNGGARLD